jgi:uncharacterized protein (TIGR04255 family)
MGFPMVDISPSVPKRLKKESLLEALWEIRFSSDTETVAELLPGLLYKNKGGVYPKIDRLPASNIPPPILKQDMNLRYTPTIRIDGNPYSIQIGEHVVSLSCRRPYTGWELFESEVLQLVEKLKETNLLTRPERFSLKYIDVISLGESPSLSLLNILVKLGDREIVDNVVQLRTELKENGFLHIIQIISPAQATLATGDRYEGVIIDIDTIFTREDRDFWLDFRNHLNLAHDFNKKLFFSILTKDTINNLEPEY